VIRNPPIAQLNSLNNTSGLHVEEYASGLVYFLILNSHSPLFRDPRVREAVDLAIDRNGILRTALNGSGQVAGSWVPPSVLYHDSSIKADGQDVAKAKELVAEAVEEDKISPKLTLSTEAGITFWSTTGQILQQNLEDIGFNVAIRPSDGPSHIETLERGDYDVASLSMYTELPTPLEMVAFYNGTGGLWSGADTSNTTTLLQKASSATNAGTRSDHYNELQEVIDSEHYILPLVYEPYIYAMQEGVVGFEVSSTGTLWLTDVGFSK
jgi:peptide/nickel transport system substrate-binding protein